MTNNFLFMAFSKGNEVTAEVSYKKYTGVAPVNILTINPSKQALEKIYGREYEKEPEYVLTSEDGTKSIKIDFIIKTTPETNLDIISKLTFFIKNNYMMNRDQTKVKVIDKYARTAWVTVEQAKVREIPMYSNGPANIDKDYRPLFMGEEELTMFLKTYLGIGNVMKYVNNTWIMKDDPQNYEARLEKIKSYFTGDISEVKEIIKFQPNNKVKVLFGVRTYNGKEYQTAYSNMVLSYYTMNYDKLKKHIEERQAAGALANTTFTFKNIEEYKVVETNFDLPSQDPFSTSTPSNEDPWTF